MPVCGDGMEGLPPPTSHPFPLSSMHGDGETTDMALHGDREGEADGMGLPGDGGVLTVPTAPGALKRGFTQGRASWVDPEPSAAEVAMAQEPLKLLD